MPQAKKLSSKPATAPSKKGGDVDEFLHLIAARNPSEPEFLQAVHEVAQDVLPFIADKPEYRELKVLERMTEPDRILSFRVAWQDDDGHVHINRGYRVQGNNAIGPYKGGLRFHPSVNQSILKFLAFEQTFKNSLTSLPMGGGKGGSDFDPKGRSDSEVMRFCQAFMTELVNHIGPDCDVPAGDIGVGAREIGYLFGQHKRLTRQFQGILTGKGPSFGGSLMRPEATGFGVVYMMDNMLRHAGDSLDGKTCVVSGSGNVATFCVAKLNEFGAKVVTLSDSSGFIHDPEGIDAEKLAWVMDLKNNRRGRIDAYAKEFKCDFQADAKPWTVPCDLAFPCATQNELNEIDAAALVKNGCHAISEGANMPTTPGAVQVLQEGGISLAPAKAANAGGVAVSGLEMSQNSQRYAWTSEEVDTKLKSIMAGIHEQCVTYGEPDQSNVNYLKGANIAGFVKVAEAMIAQGVH
ncbi:MAG: NADP-specific glutamate dehydrogenase [Pseudomonadales bacterium]|nr:NADP-specific glutamate dehydrogenase [Pseudomonadales bacterium]